MNLGLIDPDTQTKLVAIVKANDITNFFIAEDFWRNQQIVYLLRSSKTNNLHEITNVLLASTIITQTILSEHQEKKKNLNSSIKTRMKRILFKKKKKEIKLFRGFLDQVHLYVHVLIMIFV
jgi:hypothetical protein